MGNLPGALFLECLHGTTVRAHSKGVCVAKNLSALMAFAEALPKEGIFFACQRRVLAAILNREGGYTLGWMKTLAVSRSETLIKIPVARIGRTGGGVPARNGCGSGFLGDSGRSRSIKEARQPPVRAKVGAM